MVERRRVRKNLVKPGGAASLDVGLANINDVPTGDPALDVGLEGEADEADEDDE